MPESLAGTYVGVSAEETLGLGLGANVLVGGSESSIALQPLSVQGQAGLNLAVGVSRLELVEGLPRRLAVTANPFAISSYLYRNPKLWSRFPTRARHAF